MNAPPLKFEQLGLIGCGLMGGSFALAMKKAGLVKRVVGYSKSPSTTERARQMGVIDIEAPSALLAVSGADLVLVAVPVSATEATFKAIRHLLAKDTLVMDVSANFHAEVSQPGVQAGVHDFTRSSDDGDDVYTWTSRGGLQSPLRFHIGNLELVALSTATLRVRGSGKDLALNTAASGNVTEAKTGDVLRHRREIHIENGVFRPK